MTTIVPLRFRQAQLCFVLFTSFALAVLQNVTVDDAVLVGVSLPVFLPTSSYWHQNAGCPRCYAKPDPSYAYNKTWHYTKFKPKGEVTQAIEFTFVGSGLYIFFILANTVAATSTLTNMNFILDGVQVSTFVHVPSAGGDYEYNQTVYASDSMPYGQHTMQVVPVNDTVDHVLMFFDYLIYTMDTSSTVTTFTSETGSAIATNAALSSSGNPATSVSSTSTSIQATSAGQNIGAIAGGIFASVGMVVAISLLCYWRRKNRLGGNAPSVETAMIEPFYLPEQMPPISNESTTLSIQQIDAVLHSTELGSQRKTAAPLAPLQHANPVSSVVASPISPTLTSNAEILEQVGQLRDEVSRLRRIQNQGWNIAELQSEPPPEYSQGQNERIFVS